MAEPLPDGAVDSGDTLSVSISCSMRVLMGVNVIISAGTPGRLWELRDVGAYGSGSEEGTSSGYYQLDLYYQSTFVATLVGPDFYSDIPSEDVFQWSDLYDLSVTHGPYRRGVYLDSIDPGADLPILWTNRSYRTQSYADEDTEFLSACAGYDSGTLHYQPGGGSAAWDTGTNPGMTPEGMDEPEGLQIEIALGTFDPIVEDHIAEWRSVTVNSPIDTSGLSSLRLSGHSAADIWGIWHATLGDIAAAGLPTTVIYDGRVSQFGATADNWAQVVDRGLLCPNPGDHITFPSANGTYVRHHASWLDAPPQFFDFTIYSTWAAAQDPALSSDDLQIPLRCCPPLMDCSARSEYQPVILTPAASVNVHRPDSIRPSDWITSDGAKITVAEGANSVFTVISTGAHVTRTFVESWRAALGNNENYRHVKHAASADDIWFWALYRYLRLTINAASAGTLTLEIDYVDLEVDDNHETIRSVSYTEHAQTASYSVAVAAGANTVDIDLCFPSGGGPIYVSRVDELRLSGFAVGTYTLSALSLVATADFYLKYAVGVPRQRGDYSAIQLHANGAAGLQKVPDTASKADETDAYADFETGGNVRYVDPLTGTGTGTILDFERTAQDFADALNQVEGVDCSFDSAAEDAALEDSFANTLAPSFADWLHPVVPYSRPVADVDLGLWASVACREIRVIPGYTFRLWFDWPLWGAVDALVTTDAGGAVGAGESIEAYRTDTGATLATNSTDADGYVVCTPVPANEDLTIAMRTP